MNLLLSCFFIALLLLLCGGAAAWLLHRREVLARRLAAAGVIAAGVLGLVPAVGVLASGESLFFEQAASIPALSFSLMIDPLAAFFLLIIFLISALAALYGAGYLQGEGSAAARGRSFFFFNLLVLGMALVAAAANGMLFIIAWEIMSMAAFFLVTFEDERPQTRSAGLIYLIAAHIGVVLLFFMFWLLAGTGAGSLDFNQLAGAALAGPKLRSLIFLLGLAGFGAKAGFLPLHVWLPEAHPAAPSHVSALMSGVMIKMGLYGILRTLTWLGTPPLWWGALLVVIGLVSGLLGVLYALAQHDLKRLLAYHSVENIGIMAIGLGLGLLGLHLGEQTLAVFGFAGCLLHILNHSIFKSLLFMGAGAVKQQCHTLEIDRLGGLQKRMPLTAAAFIIGAAAISGLPLLNGFVSEFMIYFGAFDAVTSMAKGATALPLLSLLGLAAIGALAVACFTKASGVVFLGEARTPAGEGAREVSAVMLLPMLLLAGLCIAAGVAPALLLPLLQPVIAAAAQLPSAVIADELAGMVKPFIAVTGIAAGFAVLFGLLALWRRRILARRGISRAVTWDCGYSRPTARMQYTASSFVQPLTDQNRWILGSRVEEEPPQDYFPVKGSLHSHTPDLFLDKLWRPLLAAIAWLFHQLQWMQRGRISLYILYIAVVLLALLFWFGGLR
ncbi:MAG TPA: proton-conducting transporter membrane subunit [bacterium]|nr:proton-conducting transporter membrane subunit [bacterium]HPG84140.1 proton-conducting transporter membrane subunit [bacterium]HPM60515.1 proton-conducting transporter membrane subunit [bacterium]